MGPVEIRWYSLMYLIGFFVIYGLLRWRITHGENPLRFTKERLFDLLLIIFIGAIIGGRLGYVVFYDLPYFLAYPLEAVLPFSAETGTFTGLYGMSFHGGCIGAVIAAALWSWRSKKNFLTLADFIIPAVPLGYFFGRVGNFLNGELYGRATDSLFGVYFAGILRHPSQLYEAILEGLLLFTMMWMYRNTVRPSGALLVIFIGGYAVTRFVVEFVRQPDAHLGFVLGGWMTMGHVLSIAMAVIGASLYVVLRSRLIRSTDP